MSREESCHSSKNKALRVKEHAPRKTLDLQTGNLDGSRFAPHFVVNLARINSFLAFIGKPCLSAAKKWPRATLALSVGCGLVIATGYGLNLVMQSITQSLPKTFEVNAPRPALQETITRIALDTLQSARGRMESHRTNRQTALQNKPC